MSLLKRLVPTLAAAGLATAAPCGAQGSAEGSLHYGERSIAVTHAYAREARPSPESDAPGEIKILITDREAPAAVAASQQAYIAAAREGRIEGLMIALDPGGRDPRLIVFTRGAFDETSLPDLFGQVELIDLVQENGWVSGRLRSSEPRFFNVEADGAPETYALDLRFRAPVVAAPRPLEIVAGEAARASAQAAVAARSLRLIHNGSLEEIRAGLAPDHPMWTSLGRGDTEAILRLARSMLPQPEAFLRMIERMVVYRDESAIFARDGDETVTVWLRRDGDGWSVAQGPVTND